MKKQVLSMLMAFAAVAGLFGQTTAIKNGGLENWRTSKLPFNFTTNIETPQGWSSFDSIFNMFNFLGSGSTRVVSQVKKSTTVKNSGTSSAQISTMEYSDLGLMPGYLTNAKLTLDANFDVIFSGGELINASPTSVSAMVKYNSASVYDSANLYVEVINTTNGFDSIIGYADLTFPGNDNFTKIKLNIEYEDLISPANLLRFYFVSSYSDDTTTSNLLNSTLFVDDVTYSIGSTSSTYALMSDVKVTSFPNPSVDQVTISASSKEVLFCEVYSINGSLVKSGTFTGEFIVDVTQWAAGNYTYQVKDQNQVIVGKGKLSISGNTN